MKRVKDTNSIKTVTYTESTFTKNVHKHHQLHKQQLIPQPAIQWFPLLRRWLKLFSEFRNAWSHMVNLPCVFVAMYLTKHWKFIFLYSWLDSPSRPSYLTAEVSRLHSDTPRSVRLLRRRGRLVSETSTGQNTTLTRNRHPRALRDLKPQTPQAKCRRPTRIKWGRLLSTFCHTKTRWW